MYGETCGICQDEQAEGIKISGGSCGQVICTHEIYDKEEEEKDDEVFVTPVPAKKRKCKAEKKNEENDTDFPTTEQMDQSVVSSFSALPIDKVYQIMNVEQKTDKFNGEACIYLTLKGKGEYFTRVIRSTKAIYNKLYQEEKYEEDCMKNHFYIMSKGAKLTSKKWTYLDFIILKKKKL